MHFIQTPWLAVQCSGKFFDKKLAASASEADPRAGKWIFLPPSSLKKAKTKNQSMAGDTRRI